MENFFYDEHFCREIDDLLTILDIDNPVEELEDDWTLKLEESKREPLCEIDHGKIFEWIYDHNEERFPEEDERTDNQVKVAIEAAVNIHAFKALMPKLYYPNGKFFTITKQDLVTYCGNI